MKKYTSVRPASASTIEVFNVDATPSLRAFWKCNDGVGTTVKDYSQYGNHLEIIYSDIGYIETPNRTWNYRQGFLSLIHADAAIKASATGGPLDSGTNHVVVACQIVNENVLADSDMGTAWNVQDPNGDLSAGYLGYTISAGVDVVSFRISVPKRVGDLSSWPTTRIDAGNSGYASATPHAIAGAFVPGDSVRASINGAAVINTATTETGLEPPQENSFGLKSTRSSGFVGTVKPSSVANYQVWVFESEPPSLDITLQWMSSYPGKLPPWWEGL